MEAVAIRLTYRLAIALMIDRRRIIYLPSPI